MNVAFVKVTTVHVPIVQMYQMVQILKIIVETVMQTAPTTVCKIVPMHGVEQRSLMIVEIVWMVQLD